MARAIRMDQDEHPCAIVGYPFAGRGPAGDVPHDAQARVRPASEGVHAERPTDVRDPGATDVHEPRAVGRGRGSVVRRGATQVRIYPAVARVGDDVLERGTVWVDPPDAVARGHGVVPSEIDVRAVVRIAWVELTAHKRVRHHAARVPSPVN